LVLSRSGAKHSDVSWIEMTRLPVEVKLLLVFLECDLTGFDVEGQFALPENFQIDITHFCEKRKDMNSLFSEFFITVMLSYTYCSFHFSRSFSPVDDFICFSTSAIANFNLRICFEGKYHILSFNFKP
jgi:hypothetical protein